LYFSIKNEYNKLEKVILGIGYDFGGTPDILDIYDPHSRKNVLQKTFPSQEEITSELSKFNHVLKKYDVKVLRPNNLEKTNQIFSRDIGFVIDDIFFISNVIKDRENEINGVMDIINSFDNSKIVKLPDEVSVEGGDVIVHNDYIFIGTSSENDFKTKKVARTNKNAINYFKKYFPKKEIFPFELKKSDLLIDDNCLHLDCCFQPLGLGHAIVCIDAFKNNNDFELIKKIFSLENLIIISNKEMGELNSNLFSISNNIIVTNKKFKNINTKLRKLGYVLEEVDYSNISKMGGLFRCTTLPLVRL
tara:strand:- start:2261 stop:3172 length:912 start_codon:yes stop_codon:yes gene_type:complete